MKTLRDYMTESEVWMASPAEGDHWAFELPDEVLCETYVLEVTDDSILLDSTAEINAALTEWATLEDTDEGDSGVIMEMMGYGSLVGEEELNEFLPALAAGAARALASPFVRGAITGATLAGGDDEVNEGSMKREMMKNAERMSLAQFKDRYGDEDWIEDFWRTATGETEQSKTDEAKYQGREVQLNKKMAGDQKKFKVYVKDPATGNIKKVNFGHGGKTAKKLGQKTMRIRKSNPAARKNFRARHNCANPGPRTKARYWSCRNW